MTEGINSSIKKGLFCCVSFCTLVYATGIACASSEIFSIGIITLTTSNATTVDGFKSGMANYGYVEGKNLRYVFNGPVEADRQAIDSEINYLISQDVDLILTVGNTAALRAREITRGKGLPVIVSPCIDPVKTGIVKSLKNPGGNITGVQVADNTSKALEWLISIAPNVKKVYVPYNPEDAVSVLILPEVEKAAAQLGVALDIHKIHTVEESVTAIQKLSKDVTAVFRVVSPTLDARNSELSEAAIKRGIPIGSMAPLDESILISLEVDLYDAGEKAARLAHQIRQGVMPADIPIEMSEVILKINLKVAERIGIEIPDSVLMQAEKIIR